MSRESKKKSDKMKTKVTGVEVWIKFVGAVPAKIKTLGMKEIVSYVIGDGQRGLKKYPPYKHVTRKSAYGKTFVSDKQRRYVMAKIRSGEITPGYPKRTGKYQRAWKTTPQDAEWSRVDVENASSGAEFVGGANQARLNAMVGWKKAFDTVKDNIGAAITSAQNKVNAWVQSSK